MTGPLTTRADLDQQRCADCGMDEPPSLWLCCPNHRDTLSLPFYAEGELRLECAECGTIYLRVPIAG
jgi:hypothetical protein